MTEFIVIRHCEAEGNHERIFQGLFDGEVSEIGQRQLTYLAERMKDKKIDYIFSSSRKRALATAQAVNKYHNLPVIVDDSIIEINAGEWEGKPFASFPANFPEESRIWNTEPHKFVSPGGETMEDVYKRMVSFVLSQSKLHSGKTIVLATHGCAIRNLMCWAKGLDFSQLNSVNWCDNTGVNVIEVANCIPKVILENDVSHLPADIAHISRQKWWNEEYK